MTHPQDLAQLVAELRRDVRGFTGRFFYDEERGDIGYIAKVCEDKECDCEPSYNADGNIDCSVSLLDDTGSVDDIGAPIARMLNAVGLLLAEVDVLKQENRELTEQRDVLRAQHDAARAAIAAECVEHSELSGFLDTAEECRDWIAGVVAHEGDPSGKMTDFVHALAIVIKQCDRQRRRANWHEAGYDAGKAKVIEYAVDRATNALRAECDRMRPVYEAAVEWRSNEQEIDMFCDTDQPVPIKNRQSEWQTLDALRDAISTALSHREDKP